MQSKTLEFREAVAAQAARFPPAKQSRKAPVPPRAEDLWTKQAEQVATNLRSFSTFLASIRRAYLDLGSTGSHHAAPARMLDASKGLAAWEGVRWLSDRERDEVDFGVQVALKRSVDRVRELEAAERTRVAKELLQNPSSNSITRFLNLPTPSSSLASESLAAHRSLITLYLNTLLSHVSQLQIHQQETRLKRQLEKRATLGALGAAASGGTQELGRQMAEKARMAKVVGGATDTKGKGREFSEIGEVPSIYRPLTSPMSETEFSIEELLTPAQIQQFETEASLALQSTQTDLAALKLAESSLLEISALQSQLVVHLTQQTELTDKLWDESVGVTGKVEEGNTQLKKARERNRESRVWLLIFLIGASLSLLFLDYYS